MSAESRSTPSWRCPSGLFLVALSAWRAVSRLALGAFLVITGGPSWDDLDDGMRPRRQLYGWVRPSGNADGFRVMAKKNKAWSERLFVVGSSGTSLISRSGWVCAPVEVLHDCVRWRWRVQLIRVVDTSEYVELVSRRR